MGIFEILALLIFVGLVGYLIYVLQKEHKVDGVVLLEDSQRGETARTISAVLPLSMNEAEGAVFSYSCWVLMKDFTAGYGSDRVIFSKGDCPGLHVDTTSNSFLVKVKTYGTTESVLIPNIPAAKWIHFAMVVDQHAMDVYINGILRQHHTLNQLPDQNNENVLVGGGWDGTIGRLVYYPRALTDLEVRTQASEQPPADLIAKPATPNYFDMTWYIGRLNSS
jgi:hypothetical protein